VPRRLRRPQVPTTLRTSPKNCGGVADQRNNLWSFASEEDQRANVVQVEAGFIFLAITQVELVCARHYDKYFSF
jgi:hypothetical protein